MHVDKSIGELWPSQGDTRTYTSSMGKGDPPRPKRNIQDTIINRQTPGGTQISPYQRKDDRRKPQA